MAENTDWVMEVPQVERSEKPRWYLRTPEWKACIDGSMHTVRAVLNTLTGAVHVHVDDQVSLRVPVNVASTQPARAA
jgi:hypothetical protein